MSIIDLAAKAMQAGRLYGEFLHAANRGAAYSTWNAAFADLGRLLAKEVFSAETLLRIDEFHLPRKPRKPAKKAISAKRTRKAA